MVKHFLSLEDLSKKTINKIIDDSIQMKSDLKQGFQHEFLKNKTCALFFEKPSTRTYVSFGVAIFQSGGLAINMQQSSFAGRESLADVSRTLSRYVSVIIIRTFDQNLLLEIAAHSTVPIINALTDTYHPCQALADYQTIIEHKGNKKLKIAYLGDGFNVANSLIILSSKIGMDISLGCPKDYQPDKSIITKAKKWAKSSGANIQVTSNPEEAVKNVDVIYTDTWTSMGLEEEANKRVKIFQPYQVNEHLLKHANNDTIVMHCLPAHRGEEITDQVIDGSKSVVFDQAENRLHVQKAVLKHYTRQ